MNSYGHGDFNSTPRTSQLFFISSNDDHEGYRYAGLEVGHVFTTAETLYQLGAGNNDPQFAPDVGLDIVGGDDSTNLVSLQDGSSKLQLQMMGGQYSTAKISRGNLLSIWLEPLTAWQLPTTCGDRTDLSVAAGSIRIHCFVIFGTFRRCGEVTSCAGKPVVPHATQIPMIELAMPPNMNDLFGPLIYEMDIYSLKLPASGALPHRLMVQIMKEDATKPHFRVATGRFYNAPTREFATIGRVLTSAQDLEPFEGVQSHVLYVMLQLAVPMRGFDRTRPPPDVRPDSYFVIQAPPGFRMLEAVPIIHEGIGLGKVTLSPEGDAASRLNGTRQPAPTGFGSPDVAGWSFLGDTATYKLLVWAFGATNKMYTSHTQTTQDRSLIPAMTSLVMGLRVYPGNTSLPITNTLNLWSVQVFSPGDHNETMVNFTAKFYRTGLGGVPVLGRLQNALIQPLDPMVSREIATIQPLSIFFKAVEDVPAGGSIDVEASRVFDFGENCEAVHLDDGYYVTGPVLAVHQLPRIVSCMSYRDSGMTSGPYNIARIFVEGPLKGINIYGFSIPVRNPTLQEVSQILSMTDPWSDVDWNLTTRGPEGSPVCATYGGAPGAPDGTGSWRLVNKSIPPKSSVSEALAVDTMALSQADKLEKATLCIQDFEEMLQNFRQSTQEFQEMIKVSGSEKPNIAAAEVTRIEDSIEDFQQLLKQFGLDSKDMMAKCSPQCSAVGLPLEVRRNWMKAVNEGGELRKEAGESLERVRAAVTEAKALAKKELLRVAKARLQLDDDPGEVAVAKARQLVEALEEKVEPFIGIPKGKDEGEMHWIAKELEPMTEEADEAVESAKSEVNSHPLKMEIEIEEEIKEDIKEYLKLEAKKLQMSLGQFGKRIGRVRNLVANYQRDVQKAKSKELIAELKPQIVEQVKAIDPDETATEVANLVKESESLSEGVRNMGTMSLEDLQAVAKEIDAKVADATTSLDAFQQQMCPVEEHIMDQDVDEKVKEMLRKEILSEFKGIQKKIDFFRNRLKRVKGVSDRCRSQIKQRDGLRLKNVRTKVLNMMDVFREDQADKGLEGLPSKDIFRMLDRDEDGVIGRDEFLFFFDDVAQLLEEKQQSLRPSTEELESLFDLGLDGEMGLSFAAFEKLLIRFVQVVRPTTMTQNLTVSSGEVVRELKINEILEVLAGPQTTTKIKRVFCRAKDDAIGWVTVIGNAGSMCPTAFKGLRASYVTLTNWLPFALTRVASHATMVLMLDVDFIGFLEISAPVGFEWLSALVTRQPQAPYNETHSFQDLPEVSPSSQGAMLQFMEGQYTAGLRYGFEAPIYVPDVGPVTSLNAFYVSLLVANPQGPALPEGISSVVFAEPVRAIVDSMARSSNKLPGTTAELMLKLRIATAVPAPSYLQITMPPGYGPIASGQCGKRPWPGSLDFSGMEPLGAATCGFEQSVGAISYLGQQYDVFRVIIRPSSSMPLVPGLLQFRMDITNPPAALSAFYTDNAPAPGARVCGPACWSFATVMSNGSLIDAPETVPSQPPPSEMALGEIMSIWPPGRSDRPSKSSRLIFRFSLGIAGPFKIGDSMPVGQMELVGPPGTVIPTRCYHLVETRVVNLFGSIFNATQLGVDVWDPNSPVTGCEGNGETALIALSAGLIASNTYAFRIDIMNPPTQTTSNFWTMTLLDHFAKPIPSFNLWKFPEISVSTYARNSAPSCYLGDCVGAGQGIAIPMQLTLRTQNTVMTGGQLVILAPLEFGFDPDPQAPLIQGDKQTRCLIMEYENFNLSAVPYTWRMAERYCLIADRGNPLDGTGTGDTRTVRVITRYQQNPFDLRPPKTFHPNATFILHFWLHPPNTFRPSEAWHLESFSPSGEELDIGTAHGWEVIRVMNFLEHSNTGGINKYTQTISPAVTQGLATIPNFVIDFVLPANAWLADKLVLTAPRNFQMQLSFMDGNAAERKENPDVSGWSIFSLFPFCYADTAASSSETKVVSLRADLPEGRPKLAHDLSEHDTIDTTMGPHRNKRLPENVITPRQHTLKESVQLPKLLRYPSLPKDLTIIEGNEEYQERDVLLGIFREFAWIKVTAVSSNSL
eukprot:symbB.v1.2.006312.t1/scaffold354.1/size221495/7